MKARADFAKQKQEIQSDDPVAIAQLRDMAEQINAFEARLLRMHVAFTDSLISIPQIRLNQEAGRIEIRTKLLDAFQIILDFSGPIAGYGTGHPVEDMRWHIHNFAHLPDGVPCLEGDIGANNCRVLRPVFGIYILDKLFPVIGGDIDVDVR